MDFSILSDFLNSQTGAWAATLMPAPSDASGVVYRTFYKVINWIGANIGKATNADDAAKRKLQ